MGRAHEVAIASDTSGFERGIRDGIIEPVEEAEKSLDQLADAAEDAGRDGSRGVEKLEKALKEAQRESDKAEKAIRDVGDAGEDSGRKAARGMERAEEGVEEFKDEANSTAREAAASFDGSAESIIDVFQEVAANAFAGFGPAGALAGLAAAAGIGLAVSGFQAMNEEEEKSRERAAEWADAYVEAGGRILSASQVVEKARGIITDAEQYKQAQQNATNWGVTESVALLAMAGDANALAEAKAALADQERRVNELMKVQQVNLDGTSDGYADLYAQVKSGKSALEQLTGEMEAGAKQTDVYSESLRLLADHTKGATKTVDEFGDTVVDLPDGKRIYIDAETGRATDNVDAIEKKIYGVKGKSVAVSVRTSIDRAAYDNFLREAQNRTVKIKGKIVTTPGWD